MPAYAGYDVMYTFSAFGVRVCATSVPLQQTEHLFLFLNQRTEKKCKTESPSTVLTPGYIISPKLCKQIIPDS